MKESVTLILVIAAILAIIIGSCSVNLNSDHYKNVKIKKTTVKRSGESDIYLVFTARHGVFKVTDSLVDFDFSASDRFNELDVGKCYDIKTRGSRVKILSMYENIIEFKEVKCNE